MNTQSYIEALTELLENVKKEQIGKYSKGVLLLHGNDRPHTNFEKFNAIRDLNFEILPHPPYSPDLAPSDYWIFGTMKKPLKGKRFGTLQQLATAVSKWSRETP